MLPILICGCGHSGTTLLAAMLGAHPRLHFVRRETAFLTSDPHQARQRMALWDVQAEATDCIGWVEKTPAHIRHIGKALEISRGGRVVVMTRDPRDVVSSLIARGATPEAAITRWVADNAAALPYRTHPRVHFLRYEDLVTAPATMMQSLCIAIGLPWSNQILRHHEHSGRWNGCEPPDTEPPDEQRDHVLRRVWQVSQPVFDGRGRWRRDPSAPSWIPALRTAVHNMAPSLGYTIE